MRNINQDIETPDDHPEPEIQLPLFPSPESTETPDDYLEPAVSPDGEDDRPEIETPDEHPEPAVVALRHRAVERVNFASAQNGVAIIEKVCVDNPTDAALIDVRITLRASSGIIREKTWHIDRVAPGSHYSVSRKRSLYPAQHRTAARP